MALQILVLQVLDEKAQPVAAASVELLKNDKLIKAALTDGSGEATFAGIDSGTYVFAVTYTGYQQQAAAVQLPAKSGKKIVTLQPAAGTLQNVNVVSRKPFVQHTQGKVILNVEAAVTNVGTTVLEVLEKSPGVMVDRNGGIALKGKAGVLVLIDDKPTYLSGADLNNLLSSMNSSQVEQIELMPNPPAKYDASGNAGIINIKTKKSKTKGFNGTFTVAAGQGIYPKNNNSLVLNYRTGKINTFLTYSMNLTKYLTTIYALRKYYDDNNTVTSVLDQPTRFMGVVFNNTLKTGLDYFLSSKTTIGFAVSGTSIHRESDNTATATWLDAAGGFDSSISTKSSSDNMFKNIAVNLNMRHALSSMQDVSIDADWLRYSIRSDQRFDNALQQQGGYTEASRGSIPSSLDIFSAKADYTLRTGKNNTVLAGYKLSRTNTDNIASYQNLENGGWVDDLGKTNHFIYKENIHAVYSSLETKKGKFSLQAGLRYEYTSYNAHQLGNAVQKDSAFSRNYGGLFPSGYLSYEADSINIFTLTAGRRIDRPPFQRLNPFYFIINKYTYETGNPFFLPQYSWNTELSHQYKNLLTTTLSFAVITNYFSQLFLTDTVSGKLFYSQGNVGKAYVAGVSTALSVSPLKWWSVTAEANYNYKKLSGYNGNNYTTDINQLNINISNQLSFSKVYTGEISGFYTTKARNDLQELLYPTGQLSLGVSRPVFKKKGTLKLSFRDVFYTNAMEGLTQFDKATEYFILRRDSRVVNISFTYRFGKAYKANKRSSGSAADEMERVGNGS
ncbi:MAG: TonB dependent receptor [Ferruginibacter sp.]